MISKQPEKKGTFTTQVLLYFQTAVYQTKPARAPHNNIIRKKKVSEIFCPWRQWRWDQQAWHTLANNTQEAPKQQND